MKNIETLKKEEMNLADKIYIFDTTLRDGEQTPGVALTVDEKMQIAQKLNNLGVDKIEFSQFGFNFGWFGTFS